MSNNIQVTFINLQLIILLMEKLSQIQTTDTVSVQLNYNFKQDVITKNFEIILECLKDLSDNKKQSALLQRMEKMEKLLQNSNHLSSKGQKKGQGSSTFEKTQNNNQQSASDKNETHRGQGGQNNSNQPKTYSNALKQNTSGNTSGNHQGKDSSQMNKQGSSSTDMSKLQQRVAKNEGNITQNTQDIAMIFKEIQQLKNKIQNTSTSGGISNSAQNKSNEDSTMSKKDFVSREEFNAALKQSSKHNQRLNMLQGELQKTNQLIKKMQSKFQKVQSNFSELNIPQTESLEINEASKSKSDATEGQADMSVINQKLAHLQNQINLNTNNITDLERDLKNQKQVSIENLQNQDNINSQTEKELNNLREHIKGLQSNIQNVQKNINKSNQMQRNQQNSKTSIQAPTDRNQNMRQQGLNQAINDLYSKLNQLQRQLKSSVASMEDVRPHNPEKDKLPAIKRPKNVLNRTAYGGERVLQKPQKDHNKQIKKDFNDLRNQIQQWVKSYLQINLKGQANNGDLQLKIQEIKTFLGRKADQEGVRKSIQFLQNKINQLYLFLTEPQNEDAMIVRKGANCLSCSKKVQTLRGQLGPRVNWNNMTSTNYSPPKVGYSKNMGQASISRDD